MASTAKRLTTTVLTAALGATLVACSGDSGTAKTTTTSRAKAAASTTTVSTTAPYNATFAHGKAHAALTGGARQTLDLVLTQGQVKYPSFTLNYTGPGGSTLGISAYAIGYATSKSYFPEAFRVSTGPGRTWASVHGECSIHVALSGPTALTGDFTCKKVPSEQQGGRPVDVTGTFSATP